MARSEQAGGSGGSVKLNPVTQYLATLFFDHFLNLHEGGKTTTLLLKPMQPTNNRLLNQAATPREALNKRLRALRDLKRNNRCSC